MLRACAERNRLMEAYLQAAYNATASSAVLRTLPLGPEFVAALDNAEAAYVARNDAQRALDAHCRAHGCEGEIDN